MAEAVTSVATEIAAEHVVDSVSTQLGYIWNYQTNFEQLDKQLQILQGRRGMVLHKIDEAKRNGDEIEQFVQNWLDRVDQVIDEATEIIEKNKRVNMRCFKSLCPNLKKRYQHSKEAAMKTEAVSELYNEWIFDRVSFHTLPSETWLVDGYENIQSRQSTLDGILDALRDRNVKMVGVHGIGGSGKTTLVREVAKKAEEDKLFDKVVFAEVSVTVDKRKIQAVIAERLGLEFREKTEPVRADRLRDRIMQEKQILLILDDIWKELNLAAIGIPSGDKHVGVKLLLTSRNEELLNVMGSQTNFFVDVLEEEEACNMFMKIAGVGEEQRDLRSVAIEVAKECGGLLVAIITIAKALRKRQDAEHWRIALRELRNPPSFENVEGSVVNKAYTCINLSYEKLESEKLKSTFLLCSIMGCTHDASVEDLLRYAVGLDFFKEENTIEDVRDKVKILVRKLKDCSLLLGTSNSETFSIHGVVHDVGRWIASNQHKFTVINNIIPRYWAAENTLKTCTSITLYDIVEIPKSLKCPELKFFYMKAKTQFTKIPDEFFKEMSNLEVLHLIEMDLSPLPTSLCLLNVLRTLNLDKCRLGDIANIKDMENLEILVIGLENHKIELLPEEIGRLTSLRLLDLRKCSFVISPKTISRLTDLEELYMGYWYDQQLVEEVDIEKGVASLEELKDLPLLTALDIHVEDAKVLPKGLVLQKLKRYNIVIGSDGYYGDRGLTLRTLKVRSDTNVCSEDGVINQLKGIEDLLLDGKQRVNNVLCELHGEGFPTLRHLCITNNPYIQLIVDSMPSATSDAFPFLETLSLWNLVSLEKICDDQLATKCFCQLKTITVQNCGKLKNLFSFSIAKHLSQLQEIEVDDCRNMEEIFTVDRADNRVIDFHCYQLHLLTLGSLPRLRRICSESEVASTFQERQSPLTINASSSEIVLVDQLDALPLLGEKVVFPNLKELQLHEINLKRIWPNQLPSLSCWVQNLTRLHIENCSNLKYLFLASTLGSFKQLQHLVVYDCKDLQELIRIDNNCSNYVEFPSLEKLQIQSCPELREFIFSVKVSFPSLQEIHIDDMKNLKMIWQSQAIQSVQYCPKLCEVSFWECKSLENIFPASIARSLLQLQDLHVSDCGIKEIVAKGVEEAAARFAFPQLTSLCLWSLEEFRCFYPGKHTTEWPKLKELMVINCGKVDFLNFQKHDDVLAVPQPLFMVDQAFSNLEKVIIRRNHIRMISPSSLPEDLFPQLISLESSEDQSTILPFSNLEKFHNLEELKLSCCSYREIFSCEAVEKHARRFAQLRTLDLHRLHKLKQIWKQDSKVDLIIQKLEFLEVKVCHNLINLMPPSASFRNLRILKVSCCDRLISLAAASTIKSLMQLEKMSVRHCIGMTEIIANEGDVMEGTITFSRLMILELEGLTNLTSFCSGNYTFNFPLLKKLTVNQCPMMKFFSSGVLSTPNLQVSLDETNYNCQHTDLNTIFKQIRDEMLPFILEKRVLSGEDIRLVWQIFPERMKDFSNAKKLNLSGNDIGMIWQSQLPEHIFPKLKCLCVSFDTSTNFSLGILFQRFYYVEELKLRWCSYEEIFSYEEIEKYVGVLAQIKCLHLYCLDDVKQMWKKDSKLDLLPNLEILDFECCKSLIYVLLPSSSFENLKIMKIKFCESLISLIGVSTAKNLVQLEEMQIIWCKRMTHVVANEEDITDDKIIFHKLRKLELNKLQSLTSFCFGNYTIEFPFLEELIVEECPKMEIFSSANLSTPMLRKVWQDQTEYACGNDLNTIVRQHHEERIFSREKLSFKNIRMILQKLPEQQEVFSNLEQLSFSRDEIGMIWQSHFPQDLFPKLGLLEVFEDKSTVFSLAILQRFHNVEKLELNCGSYEEIFLCEDVEKHVGTLARMKSLSLYRLDHLKQMWKQDSKLDLILQNLESLRVKWCSGLVTLMPPSSSFRNLTGLSVEGCDGLMSLLASSTAKSLMQLGVMTIRKCNMMTEVISSNEEALIDDEIIFSKLWSLNLDDLSSLTSFYSGNSTINFPCLWDLSLIKCPNIKFFSPGVLNAPKLEKICVDDTEYVCDDDLNATIQGMHEKLNAKTSPEYCAGPSTLSSSSVASSTI